MLAAPPPPPPSVEPGYAEVRRLDLQAAFHAKVPWTVYALAPQGKDADTGERPVRICFRERPAAKPECTAITSGLDDDGTVYRYQTLEKDGLAVEPLGPGVKGVVARATFSGGGSGTLTQTLVWTFSGGARESFQQTSATKLTNLGEDRRFAEGPMAGYYLTADFVWGEDETHWDPHRFTIDAYRLTKGGGYLRVLSYVTTVKYPAERETPDYVIDRELPHLAALLKAAYPEGPAS